jgi:trk system potassium uptake protein
LTYLTITAAGVLALKFCGLNWLDSICHAFSAMGLGGFSTHDANVAHFNSLPVEAVLIFLMVLASLNFARHFVALRNFSFAPYKRDTEAKAILLVLLISVALITLVLWAAGTYPTVWIALRHAAFNVVSVATTTGFVSQNYELWPSFAPVWMLLLCCILCSTGSTGGGIKMFRTLLLAREANRELKLLVHPSAIMPIRIGGQVIPERVINSVLAFIFLYFMTIVGLTFALLLTGFDLVSSFTAIVSSINNTGPGLGVVGPANNYASLTDLQTWICTVAMLLGRLEIFSVLVLFTPVFWRK